eukprot:m51a1_g5648 hypothetical protein (140) ;mRNA; f:862064-862614
MIAAAEGGFTALGASRTVVIVLCFILGAAAFLTGIGMWIRGDTWSYTVLTVFGVFLLSLATLLLLNLRLLAGGTSDETSRAAFYLIWAIVAATFLHKSFRAGGVILFTVVTMSVVVFILSAVFHELFLGVGLVYRFPKI